MRFDTGLGYSAVLGSASEYRGEDLCVIEYALISPFYSRLPHTLRYGPWSPVKDSYQSRVPPRPFLGVSLLTTATETHHDDVILGHFDLPVVLLQLHLRGPIGGRFVPVVVLVRHLAEDHEVQLVVAVRVDLNGAVVAAGDVRPDAFAEVADF